jgi:hypothetical protein
MSPSICVESLATASTFTRVPFPLPLMTTSSRITFPGLFLALGMLLLLCSAAASPIWNVNIREYIDINYIDANKGLLSGVCKYIKTARYARCHLFEKQFEQFDGFPRIIMKLAKRA